MAIFDTVSQVAQGINTPFTLLDYVRDLIPAIYRKAGWVSTYYLFDSIYYPGIREFSPPEFRLPNASNLNTSEEGNYDETMKPKYVYSSNWARPIGRTYLPSNKVTTGEDSTTRQTGYVKMLREDWVKFVDVIKDKGGRYSDEGFTILELIGDTSTNPLSNTLNIYRNVRVTNIEDPVKTLDTKVYVNTIGLFFPKPTEMYSLQDLVPFTLPI